MKNKIYGILLLGACIFAQPFFSQSWIPQGADISGPGLFISDISAINTNVAWAIAGSYVGGFCGTPMRKFTRTTDGGTTWRSGNIAAPSTHNAFNICAIDSLTAWVSTYDLFNVSNGRVYKTSNGGLTWAHQSSATFSGTCKFVHFFNANEGVAVGENQIFTTTNGGTNWVPQSNLPFPFNQPTFLPINSYEVLGNKIWLGDYAGFVYYSNDKGLNWAIKSGQSAGLGSVKAVAFKDSLNGLLISSYAQSGGGSSPTVDVDDGTFYKTSDGGSTWVPVLYSATSFTYSSRFMAKYDICYVKGSSNTYILSSEYSQFDSFSAITTDGGTTWSFIDSLQRRTALAFVPDGNGWCGGLISSTSNGIYKLLQAPPTNTNVNMTAIEEYQKMLNENIKILYDGNDIFVSNSSADQNIHSLIILTVDGKKVKTLNSNSEKRQNLETESLSKGTYILEVGIGKSILHKKLIVD